MADQTRVQPVGLFNHLKITIHNIPYTIAVTIVEMADQQADYSMILGRPWLRDAKVEHDWGHNQITLGGPQASITIPVLTQGYVHHQSQPDQLEGYDWTQGLTNEQETTFLPPTPPGSLSAASTLIPSTPAPPPPPTHLRC